MWGELVEWRDDADIGRRCKTTITIEPGITMFRAGNDNVKLFRGTIIRGVVSGVKTAVGIPSNIITVAKTTRIHLYATAIGIKAQN